MQSALVAHSSQVIAGAIQRTLNGLRFEVRTTDDGNAMLAILGKEKPGLIVIEAALPPFGAAQAIIAVRGFDSGGAKIVAVLLDSDFARAASLRGVGANEVILGGFDSTKLTTKLRALGLLNP